ncbi:MAG: hypothetical protein GQ477_02460 [Nanohaloarchaea archaeon]|nr:hypothetical protein [Candidatus Nanohaloarchaea archaeon]
MDKQQKEEILRFIEKNSVDISSQTNITSNQVEQYIRKLTKNIKSYEPFGYKNEKTMAISPRFFRIKDRSNLDIHEIYSHMVQNIGDNSKINVEIKSGGYLLHIPAYERDYSPFIVKPNDSRFEKIEYDNVYDAGKKFAELVDVNYCMGLNWPALNDIISMFKS